jgi:two-component system response regulator AlgR
MKVLIVDDEPLARARLRRLLLPHPAYEVVGEAADGGSGLQMAIAQQPDLVFLDIEMPDRNGLSVAAELMQLVPPPAVVFVTAHPQHALAAYQVAPADYLLKPISAERLATSLQRLGLTTKAHLEKQQEQHWISYKSGSSLRRIELQQLYYLQADDKYVRMVFAGGEALTELSLKQFEDLYPEQLLRIHRNTLVLKRRLKALHSLPDGRHVLELWQSDDLLEISRRELSRIRQLLLPSIS